MTTPDSQEWTDEEFRREVGPVKVELRAYEAETRGAFGHFILVVGAVDKDGENYLYGRARWRCTRGIAVADEFLSLPKENAQQLFDALWRAGLRPTEVGTGCARCGSADLEEQVLVAAGPNFRPFPVVATAPVEDPTAVNTAVCAVRCRGCGHLELTEKP